MSYDTLLYNKRFSPYFLEFGFPILDTRYDTRIEQRADKNIMTSGKLYQTWFKLVYFLSMFTNMLLVEKEMSSPTPAESEIVKTTDVGYVYDENCTVAMTLNMTIKKIDVVIYKAFLCHLTMKMKRRQ